MCHTFALGRDALADGVSYPLFHRTDIVAPPRLTLDGQVRSLRALDEPHDEEEHDRADCRYNDAAQEPAAS